MSILRKFVTVFFVIIQCALIVCALVVVSESETPTNIVDIATFLVAYYALGASSWRLLGVIFSYHQKTPDGKGVLDL